jgi:hypothetical protein
MHTVSQERVREAREIEGRILQGRDVFVRTTKFAQVANVLWPVKTAAHLASIANRDERTAKRWLAGEFEPPNAIVLAVMAEVFGGKQ